MEAYVGGIVLLILAAIIFLGGCCFACFSIGLLKFCFKEDDCTCFGLLVMSAPILIIIGCCVGLIDLILFVIGGVLVAQ